MTECEKVVECEAITVSWKVSGKAILKIIISLAMKIELIVANETKDKEPE